MTTMADKLTDLIGLIVWRVPTPAQLERMSDLDAEQRYLRALGKDRQLAGSVIAAEIERRDEAAKAAAFRRRQRDERQAAARARRSAERTDYDVWVEGEFVRAEAYTRGHMLSPAGKARQNEDGTPAIISPVVLWAGPDRTARAWASEELRNYWDDMSPRLTFAEWKRQTREPAYDPTAPVAA